MMPKMKIHLFAIRKLQYTVFEKVSYSNFEWEEVVSYLNFTEQVKPKKCVNLILTTIYFLWIQLVDEQLTYCTVQSMENIYFCLFFVCMRKAKIDWIVWTDLLFKRLENQRRQRGLYAAIRMFSCLHKFWPEISVFEIKWCSAPTHPPADKSVPYRIGT